MRAVPNRLLGQPAPTAPNQVWVDDITYLPRQGGGWHYLTTWLGRYSHKVVWGVHESVPEALVGGTLCCALAVRRPLVGLLVHSDQGSQYSATSFKALLARHEAVQSRSRRGNCYDHAPAESFWSRLKSELLNGGSFRNSTEARLASSHYLAYYNAERRYSSLGYSAPNYFETRFQTTSQLCAAWLDHPKYCNAVFARQGKQAILAKRAEALQARKQVQQLLFVIRATDKKIKK